ncbi:MAG: outer membrane lipoprotein LolB [bacterium]|nr:outer membrane lipoprotein LolB [bacterium]
MIHKSLSLSFILSFILSLCLVTITSCSRLKYDILPDSQRTYHSLTVRVNVKYTTKKGRQKQNFKIVLKYDANQDKMLFLSPLNQVYGQLFVKNEQVLLINTKKKRSWKGHFASLIKKIWGLDLNYSQFKALILKGTLPTKKMADKGLDISIEKDEKNIPKRIIISRSKGLIKLKIYNRKTGKGIINFSPPPGNIQETDIEDVINQ